MGAPAPAPQITDSECERCYGFYQLATKTRIASETKYYNCVELSIGPESRWQILRFQKFFHKIGVKRTDDVHPDEVLSSLLDAQMKIKLFD